MEDEEESLFLACGSVKATTPVQTPTPPREYFETLPKDDEMTVAKSPLSRYNEDTVPNKRRRMEDSNRHSPLSEKSNDTPKKGPFVDNSDSEDEQDVNLLQQIHEPKRPQAEPIKPQANHSTYGYDTELPAECSTGPGVPRLNRESTSIVGRDDFEGIEDFIDEEFPEEGEEHLERRWMEEQSQFEMALEEDGDDRVYAPATTRRQESEQPAKIVPPGSGSTCCPMCGSATTGMTEEVRWTRQRPRIF